MPKKNSYKKILLLTENLEIIQQVESFAPVLKEHHFQLHIKQKLEQDESYEVVLIHLETADAMANLPMQNSALIYLSRNSEDTSLVKKYVDEIIDLGKITAAGFIRAITNAIEKFYVKKELHGQKALLHNLIDSLKDSYHLKEIDFQSDDATFSLIEQNKQLLKLLQMQNEDLKSIARVDALTKAGNRLNFEETLSATIANAARHRHMFALLILDLDKFKNVNDTLGHQMGDLLLVQVTERLREVIRKGDFIARLGGDEFAIILNEIQSSHSAGIVAWKIIQEIEKPFHVKDQTLHIGVSIGIASYPMIGETAEELIKNADMAMYEAKKLIKNKYAFANLDIQEDHLKKIKIEQDLKNAIDKNELSMVYQPIYETKTKKIHSFEALVRWKNSELGMIPPTEFIPIAENSGFIIPMSQWIFETICQQIVEWRKASTLPHKISINLSPKQLIETDLIKMIDEITTKYEVPIGILEFEITEMSVIEESEMAERIISNLCSLGATQAIDDFGTGYSTMRYLKFLPVSTIKIDHSFVHGLGKQKTDDSIVSSIIALAKKMGLKVVAEGVETQEQLHMLKKEHCDYVQGYLFSKPVSGSDAMKLLLDDHLNK